MVGHINGPPPSPRHVSSPCFPPAQMNDLCNLKRDENGKVTDIENPSGLFVRNAEVGVIANSEDLRFSLR